MRAPAILLYVLALFLPIAGCHKLLGDYTLEPGCIKGTKQCVGNVLQVCNSQGTGFANSDICASENLCDPNAGVCLASTCAVGERRCLGAELQLCNATRDGWIDLLACASAGHCSGEKGSCTEEPCAPGMLQCNGNLLQSCREDRLAWNDVRPCGSAALCNKDEHKCDDAKCQLGEFRCEGAAVQACKETLDGWTTVKTCDSAALCDKTTGTCGNVACTIPGAFNCSGDTLEQCADDLTRWNALGACQSAAYCDAVNGRCADTPCVPGARQCSGATVVACRTDQTGWDPVATCQTDALCQQTVSTGAPSCVPPVCELGNTRCTGAQPEVCNAGRSAYRPNGAACATVELCYGGSATCGTPMCALGGTNCSGAQPQFCNAGRTAYESAGLACASEALCNPTTGTCGAEKCLAGQLRCDPLNPTALQTCKADLTDWEALPCDVCDTPELCSASLAATTCGASSCQEPACDAGVPRCAGTGADEGKVLEVCNSGRTGYTSCETCVTTELCDVSLETEPFACTPTACTDPSCALADRWCGGSGNVALYQCPSSRINTEALVIASCATARLCELTHEKNKTTCEQPTCNLNDRWCGGSGNRTLYQCPSSRVNAEAGALDTCVTGGLCEQTRQAGKTACEAPKCAAGQANCGGSGNRTLQVCNNERTGFNDCATCGSAQLCTDSLGATTCNASACLVCDADEARCNAAGNYEVCRADRKGFTTTNCDGNGCSATTGCAPPSTGGTSP